MQLPLAAALISFVVTFALARLMLHWSPKLGMLDFPNPRKIHTETTPVGGAAVVGGILVSVLLLINWEWAHIGWLLGAMGLAALGIIDDKIDLSAQLKLVAQLLIALLPVMISGIQLNEIQILSLEISLGVWAIPLSILWIVGVTNAINLIDGLDGLAIGAVGIAAGTFIVINLQTGNELGLVLAAALCGGSVGFILFNAHPARLFLGDGGSYFLGYTLALLGIISFSNNPTATHAVPLLVVMLILLYPIADTLWAIVRRMLARRSIFTPDQQHLHHQIIKLNLEYRMSVFLLYALLAISSLIALVVYSA